jgi:hypothetical protein
VVFQNKQILKTFKTAGKTSLEKPREKHQQTQFCFSGLSIYIGNLNYRDQLQSGAKIIETTA